jgi:DNA polymerase-3 subunit beta
MEIRVKRENLLRGLYLVQGVVERRSPQPILAHVLIEQDEAGIALTATDLEIGLRGHVDASVKKAGPITVNARKLYEIVREVVAEELTLKAAGGWVEVVAGPAKFKVVSLDVKEFPELPFTSAAKGSSIRLAAGTLREMIDRTIFAVSTDETRFTLSGVFLEVPDGGVLRMVATDGHRLALIDRSLTGAKLGKGVILPRKGLVELRKLLDDGEVSEVTLSIGDRDARFQAGTVSLFMRLVEGEFPDYRQVIPKDSKVRASLDRDQLLGALRRTALLASERSHGVRLSLERGTLSLSASNPEQGEASEDLEVAYQGSPVSVGFNARYLIEVLGVHAQGDSIELGLTDEVGPGVVKGSQDPTYTYVLMPMRL